MAEASRRRIFPFSVITKSNNVIGSLSARGVHSLTDRVDPPPLCRLPSELEAKSEHHARSPATASVEEIRKNPRGNNRAAVANELFRTTDFANGETRFAECCKNILARLKEKSRLRNQEVQSRQHEGSFEKLLAQSPGEEFFFFFRKTIDPLRR